MADAIEESRYARFALRCSNFAERWFPDSWVFAALAVIIVAVATLGMGAAPTEAAKAFGDGFWSLIPFTMQMAFVVIGGYVVASSPPAVKLIDRLARIPKNGRSAVAWVALISMVASLLNWGLSLVFGGLLVRALARRTDLRMDYRAAGAAAYLGLGAVWALGLSSSGRAVAGQPGQFAAVDPVDHRGDPVHRHHLPVAIRRTAAGADRGLADHRLRHRARPEQRPRRQGLRGRPGLQPAHAAGPRHARANGWNTARC